MATLIQDVRYALRTMRKAPGFTAIAVITLALGIGATSAMFSVIDRVLLQPLPYPEPERLVQLQWASSRGIFAESLNAMQAQVFPERSGALQDAAVMFPSPGCNLVGGSRPEYVESNGVSTSFFRTFGVQPFLGRDFIAGDVAGSTLQSVILSYRIWHDRFGANRSVLGQQIKCNGAGVTVVGVLPPSFRFADPADVWTPYDLAAFLKDTGSNYRVFGRLKPGLTLEQAQQHMDALAEPFRREFPKYVYSPDPQGVRLVAFNEAIRGNDRKPLLLLFGAVALVMLIGCANIAGLMLARAVGRGREVAIRAALGARRVRIVGQLLVEAVTLNVLGGAAGVLLAWWLIGLLNVVVPERFPTVSRVDLDLPVLGFALGASLLTGVLSGIVPAWQTSRADLNHALKEGERGAAGGRQVARKLLVGGEVALALVLLAGSTLSIRGFLQLRSVSPGFEVNGLQATKLSLSSQRYRPTATVAAFCRDVLARIRVLPGVESASAEAAPPLRRGLNLGLKAGQCQVGGIQYRAVATDFFATMKIPLRRGRVFGESEPAPVAVVNETVAQRCWPGQDAAGMQLQMSTDAPRQVVGVVGDTHDLGVARRPPPVVYVPVEQVPDWANRYSNGIFLWSIVIRTNRSGDLATAVERAIHEVDPEQPVISTSDASQLLSDSMLDARLLTALMSVFAGFAALLTGIGLYGLLRFFVSQRTHEIGIRMALGATDRQVIGLVLREGVLLVGIGGVAGLLAAVGVSRLMAGVVYGVRPGDPLTFVAAALALLAIAALACYIPARRATKVDPMVALRYE